MCPEKLNAETITLPEARSLREGLLLIDSPTRAAALCRRTRHQLVLDQPAPQRDSSWFTWFSTNHH
jgi:hypothetical protein